MSQKTENSAKETYEYLIERIEKSENTYDIYHQFKRLKEFLDKEIQNERVSEIWAKEKLSYIENEISRLKSDLGIISEQTFIIDVTNLQKQFEYMFPTMKAYLESKGMILPIDAGDMLEIFIERAFNDGEHGHLKTLLNRNDFIEFHKMIEARLIEIEPKRKQPKPNQFRKGLEKLSQENEPKRNQFVSDAKEFLIKKMKAGKPRSDFITEKGWPTVKFYRDPFRGSEIAVSTRKDWLKKAISKDEV